MENTGGRLVGSVCIVCMYNGEGESGKMVGSPLDMSILGPLGRDVQQET